MDAVLRHNVLTMALFNRGRIAAVAAHLREGIGGSVQLRLPLTRVQLRWMEGTLAHWHGDLDLAEQLFAQARDRHRQTELYGADVAFLGAHLSLAWDRGRPRRRVRGDQPLVRAAGLGCARRSRGGRDRDGARAAHAGGWPAVSVNIGTRSPI